MKTDKTVAYPDHGQVALELRELCFGRNPRTSEVTINSAGVAAKCARDVALYKGIDPSASQVEEAAQAGVAAAWQAFITGDQASMKRMAYAGANTSLRRDVSGGMTGDNNYLPSGYRPIYVDSDEARAESWELSLASLKAWADGGGQGEADESEPSPEREAWRAKLAGVLDLKGKGIAAASDRKRYAFLCGIIDGGTMHDSAVSAGFSGIKYALASLDGGRVWERLGLTKPRGLFCGWRAAEEISR